MKMLTLDLEIQLQTYCYFWSFASESIVLICEADKHFTSAPELAVCACVWAAAGLSTASMNHPQENWSIPNKTEAPPSKYESPPSKSESPPQGEWEFCEALEDFVLFTVNLFILVWSVFPILFSNSSNIWI